MVKSSSTKMGDWFIAFLCFLLILICILPILNVAARSLSSTEAIMKREVLLWPVGLNFDSYLYVLKDPRYTYALGWTAVLTVICVCVSMTMTTLAAFPLTYDALKFRKAFNGLMIFTMYFSAGTIPTYLLLKSLNMLDKPTVMIIPSCLSVFNMIIMRSFFYGVPESLRESAEIDGAGPIRTLLKIYLPLSLPVMATVSLFYAVGRWNGYSDALMYVKTKELFPIQLLLFNLLQNMMAVDVATAEGFSMPGLRDSIKTAVVMVATIPILMVYPWLQRFFIAGSTLGAVKE